MNWSKSEVEAAVEDYFDMLRSELTGQKYNKSEHRRYLKKTLNNRSDGSVELKHQNISAVLIEMGIQPIVGYKPRYNYQRSLLPSVVAGYLNRHPELNEIFSASAEFVPEVPTVDDFLGLMESPPVGEEHKWNNVSEPGTDNYLPQINYLEREARNQKLGDAGEAFVINYEKARLINAGKENLAAKIEQVSRTIGPSAGFDIHSYETSGKDRLIEAKTTKYGKETPFYITPNELRCSRDNADSFFLYRIFKFDKTPRMYSLHGQIERVLYLEPTLYLAVPEPGVAGVHPNG